MTIDRKPILAGNWKMNKTRDEALEFIFDVNNKITETENVETILFTPSLLLNTLVKRVDTIKIGAQNMHYLDKGAYTGEISAPMLQNVGVSNILIGHSERREYFAERDGDVNLKIKQALKYNMKPMVCIGENLNTKELNKTKTFIDTQIKVAFLDIKKEFVKDIVIAYEPIWAIGTGVTPTPEEAEQTISDIRKIIASLYSTEIAKQVRILYGGSVKPGNLRSFLAMENIDGVLVGGASLNSKDFLNMYEAFK